MTPKRISSRSTFVVKRIYPIIFVAGIVLIVAMPLIGAVTLYQPPPIWFSIPAALLLLIVGWLIMRTLVFGLADEVFDEGDALLVRNNKRDVRIPLSNIAAVRYASWLNPGKVTVALKEPCAFGAQIAFLPRTRFLPFLGSPVVWDLSRRIAAQRPG